MLCDFWFSDLGLDNILESRIEIRIINALRMTKLLVVFYLNMMCLDMLGIVLCGVPSMDQKSVSDKQYETPSTDRRLVSQLLNPIFVKLWDDRSGLRSVE